MAKARVKKAILGIKLGMTQVFDENGKVVPVTVIRAYPNRVVQVKKEETDGYSAIQLGFLEAKEKKVTKPLLGHFKKANLPPFRVLKEVRVEDISEFNVGDELKVSIFSEGEYVDVTGTSKGRGFAGVMKRWGFSGGPDSHGSRFHRAPGSIGMCADPSKVFKGKKLPGHYGNERVTVQNLRVVKVVPDEDLIFLKGAVPGFRKSVVLIKESVKKRGS